MPVKVFSPLSRIKPVRPVSLISTSALRVKFALSIAVLSIEFSLYLTKSLLSCCIIKAARAKSALLLIVILLLVNPFIVTVCPDPSKDRTPSALLSRSELLSRSTPPQSISSMTFEDVLVNDQPLKL